MKKNNIPKELADVFGAIDKLNSESDVLSNNALSIVNGFIDTGSYALNAILSGSLYGGIPKGRITGLCGPAGCGKTLILNKVIANAQKEDPQVWGVVWDSENAFEPEMARNVGADPDRIKHCPVESVEDCRNEICVFLDKIAANKSLYGKFIIGIDSLANLASSKELADAAAGKAATDMGLRAKSLKSMMRTLTYKCAKTNTTLVFTNHVYDDPAALFPSLVKNQSGGKGPVYLSSLVVQLAVKREKEEQKDKEKIIAIANKVKGVTMRALTTKNRFIPPFLETELYLNFKSGLFKYSGLLDMAVAYKLIIQTGATYQLPDGKKLGFYKSWKNDDSLWTEKILPPLDKIIKEEFVYSRNDVNDEPETAEPITEDE